MIHEKDFYAETHVEQNMICHETCSLKLGFGAWRQTCQFVMDFDEGFRLICQGLHTAMRASIYAQIATNHSTFGEIGIILWENNPMYLEEKVFLFWK